MRRSLLGSVSSGSAHKGCVPEAAKVDSIKSQPRGIGCEGMKGSWGAAEAWHCVAGLEFLKGAQELSLVDLLWHRPTLALRLSLAVCSNRKRARGAEETGRSLKLPQTNPLTCWREREHLPVA